MMFFKQLKKGKNTAKFLGSVIILVFLISFIAAKTVSSLKESPLNASILIRSDAELEALELPGNGSEINPFRIENLEIGAMISYGIFIDSISYNLIIQNCSFEKYFTGIQISNALESNIIIRQNSFFNLSKGIGIHNIGEILIENNTITYCSSGLTLYRGMGAVIKDNYVSSNFNYYYYGTGIRVDDSEGAIIENNTIENFDNGIEITECHNCSISYNIGTNISICMLNIQYCMNGTIENNTVTRMGSIFLYHFYNLTILNNNIGGLVIYGNDWYLLDSCTISNNTVKGKPIEIYQNQQNLVIADSPGQVLLYNCTNTIIENITISESSNCILASDCENLQIRNCTLEDSNEAISIRYSNYVQILNNQIISTSQGIDLYYVSSLTVSFNNISDASLQGIYCNRISGEISANIITDCEDGVLCYYALFDTGILLIYNNEIINCGYGLELQLWTFDTELVEVAYNNFSYCYYRGIHVIYTRNLDVHHNIISHNKLGMYGYIEDSEIYNNQFIENEGYGLYLQVSYNNLIYRNIFDSNNLKGVSQACDDGSSERYYKKNTWYNIATLEGNSWSDWRGFGYYKIDGNPGEVDKYPFVIDTETDDDSDTLPDQWEELVGLDPLDTNGLSDPDEDGLTNYQELIYRTNPLDDDSDDDNLLDGEEINQYYTKPLERDTDGDGHSDGYEVAKGTNPNDEQDFPTKPEPTSTDFRFFGPVLFLGSIIFLRMWVIKHNKKEGRT